jgi:hypothetical protein
MNPDFKAAARAAWVARIQNSLTIPPPPTEAMERWIRYNQAMARYSESFHGALQVGYNTSGPAFDAVVKALELGFQAAAGPYQRRPLFRGV